MLQMAEYEHNAHYYNSISCFNSMWICYYLIEYVLHAQKGLKYSNVAVTILLRAAK